MTEEMPEEMMKTDWRLIRQDKQTLFQKVTEGGNWTTEPAPSWVEDLIEQFTTFHEFKEIPEESNDTRRTP